MGEVTVQDFTTLNPISLCGIEAGVCWKGDTSDSKKNYLRGLKCIEDGHWRVTEYPQVYLILDGYSARVIRELYTHIGGGPTRLQASTRYIKYGEFKYITPPSIAKDSKADHAYRIAMENIMETYQTLEMMGIPKEDIANLLPLGMETKVVLRTNLRNLIDMSHQRLCTRAYWEFRQLMKDIMKALSEYSSEWKYLVDNYFIAKCEVCGYCTESNGCGRRPSKDELNQIEVDDGK